MNTTMKSLDNTLKFLCEQIPLCFYKNQKVFTNLKSFDDYLKINHQMLEAAVNSLVGHPVEDSDVYQELVATLKNATINKCYYSLYIAHKLGLPCLGDLACYFYIEMEAESIRPSQFPFLCFLDDFGFYGMVYTIRNYEDSVINYKRLGIDLPDKSLVSLIFNQISNREIYIKRLSSWVMPDPSRERVILGHLGNATKVAQTFKV